MATEAAAASFTQETGKSHLKILVVGKTGVGKSALINALVGDEICKESQMETGTHEVQKIETEIYNGVKVTFYDSPGLHDAKGNEREYLQQIIDSCQDLDLVLYCVNLTDKRVTQEDCDTICEFTNALGEDFWKNSVFVLTFANNVRPKVNRHDPESQKKALHEKVKKMSKKLREVLKSQAKLPSKIVKDIPFVPAGYHTPVEEHQFLQDGTHWFTNFWISCFMRVKEVGRPAVINGCLDMFEVEREESTLIQDLPQNPATAYPVPALYPLPDERPSAHKPFVESRHKRNIPMSIRLPLEIASGLSDNMGYIEKGTSVLMGF